MYGSLRLKLFIPQPPPSVSMSMSEPKGIRAFPGGGYGEGSELMNLTQDRVTSVELIVFILLCFLSYLDYIFHIVCMLPVCLKLHNVSF